MLNDKIMAGVNLQNIVTRLTYCCVLLKIVHGNMESGDIRASAIGGVSDLLESICKDFRADIEGAEDANKPE